MKRKRRMTYLHFILVMGQPIIHLDNYQIQYSELSDYLKAFFSFNAIAVKI